MRLAEGATVELLRLHLVNIKSVCSGRADDFDNTVGGAPVQLQSSMWSR